MVTGAIAGLVLLLAASACSLLVSLDPHGLDASTTFDAGTDSRVSDAAEEPVVEAAAACVSGQRVFPTSAFDATLDGGPAMCAPEEILAIDGRVAGLDRFLEDLPPEMDGHRVTGCVGAEFGVSVSEVTIRARAASNACGIGCWGSGCGAGDTMSVFVGQTRGAYSYRLDLDLTPTLTDYPVGLPARAPWIVVVCRGGWGRDQDDVEVDAISATCP